MNIIIVTWLLIGEGYAEQQAVCFADSSNRVEKAISYAKGVQHRAGNLKKVENLAIHMVTVGPETFLQRFDLS